MATDDVHHPGGPDGELDEAPPPPTTHLDGLGSPLPDVPEHHETPAPGVEPDGAPLVDHRADAHAPYPHAGHETPAGTEDVLGSPIPVEDPGA